MSEYRKYTIADIPVLNIGTYLLTSIKHFGDAVALVDGDTDEIITYKQLCQRIERAAAGFQKIGVAKGDVICFMSPNHVDFVTACYAALLVSAVCQPINPSYTKDDLSRSVKNCNTKFVVTIPELVPVVKEGISGHGAIKVVVLGEAPGCIPFAHLLDPAHGQYTTPPVNPKTDVALFLSSSGTTGFPKATRITHFSLAVLLLGMKWMNIVEQADTGILFLPLFHFAGLCVVAMGGHTVGEKLVLMSKFVPDNFLRLIDKYKTRFRLDAELASAMFQKFPDKRQEAAVYLPNALTVVPPVMVMLAKHPGLSKYDLSSVEQITCGAAPLSPKVEEAVKERLKLKLIHQGYGMTEVGLTHVNTGSQFRYKSVGKLTPLTEMKIVDVETGRTLGHNQEGEIWIRGPQVCLGYLNMPRETKEMFLEDGWVRTGDVGKEDTDGFLYIVDRIKELIKYKGFQVAPATLEDILLHHDKVADVGVVGVPDEEAGELPKAYVVKKAGTRLTAEELVKFVEGKVASHMKLRGGVEFVDEIPRSVSGKILRRVLRERAISMGTSKL